MSCANSCTEPLRFPKRPNDPPNRPGLSHINYRIGTFADFREAMIRQLNATPNLVEWTHRKPDDPGIALLEGAAILGDILTFIKSFMRMKHFLGRHSGATAFPISFAYSGIVCRPVSAGAARSRLK